MLPGFIVNDYVTGDDSCLDYLHKLAAKSGDFNGFLFVAFELNKRGLEAAYYSTHFDQPPKLIDCGVHGFGNSLDVLNPWPKVVAGRKRFEAIMSGHRTTETKAQLVQDIFDMLSDRTILPLDNQVP